MVNVESSVLAATLGLAIAGLGFAIVIAPALIPGLMPPAMA